MNTLKLIKLLSQIQNPIPIAVYIRCMCLSGCTLEEIELDITQKIDALGRGDILNTNLDLVGKIYHDMDRSKKHRVLLGSHTDSEWEEKKREYGFKCFYCGKDDVKLSKDHVIPVSLGGLNTIGNIVPACMSCNRKKGNKLNYGQSI